MTATDLPRPLRPFVEFPALLRDNGFATSPDQTIAFVEAVGLLGPRDMADIYRAATATLAPPHERRAEFDALFRFLFHGHSLASAQDALDPEDDIRIQEDRGGTMEPPEPDEQNLAGEQAATVELLTARAFPANRTSYSLRVGRSFSSMAAFGMDMKIANTSLFLKPGENGGWQKLPEVPCR